MPKVGMAETVPAVLLDPALGHLFGLGYNEVKFIR